jgi:hypothetical protein
MNKFQSFALIFLISNILFNLASNDLDTYLVAPIALGPLRLFLGRLDIPSQSYWRFGKLL